jgi:hypothetical protein
MRMSGIFALGRTGMLVNGWRSDRRREARRHTAWAAAVGALGLMPAAVAQQAGSSLGLLAAPALSAAGTMGSIPVFWSLPPRFMSGTALAAGVALINSCANLAGYFAPRFLGGMKESTGSYALGLFAIAGVELIGVVLIFVFIRKEPSDPRVNLTLETYESYEDRPRNPEKWLLEIYDEEFLRAHPDLTTLEFAAYLKTVRDYEQRIASGELPDLDTYARAPFGYAEAVHHIKDSAAHIREICAAEPANSLR